ncbi:MAG: hypothetical protein IJN03_02165 [Bacilli bacterium]|nr:hypothetical protein [Bacilli bacterium]
MKNINKKSIAKIKNEKIRNEEQDTIIKFVGILIVVVLIIVAIYFLTKVVVKSDSSSNTETNVAEINYSKTVFGTMLNRPYEEYYVFAYSNSDNKAGYYSAITNKYMADDSSLFVYFVDLDDNMNKDYISEDGKTNSEAKNLDELKVGETTLIKVKNGKITKYIEEIGEIEKEFGIN